MYAGVCAVTGGGSAITTAAADADGKSRGMIVKTIFIFVWCRLLSSIYDDIDFLFSSFFLNTYMLYSSLIYCSSSRHILRTTNPFVVSSNTVYDQDQVVSGVCGKITFGSDLLFIFCIMVLFVIDRHF